MSSIALFCFVYFIWKMRRKGQITCAFPIPGSKNLLAKACVEILKGFSPEDSMYSQKNILPWKTVWIYLRKAETKHSHFWVSQSEHQRWNKEVFFLRNGLAVLIGLLSSEWKTHSICFGGPRNWTTNLVWPLSQSWFGLGIKTSFNQFEWLFFLFFFFFTF